MDFLKKKGEAEQVGGAPEWMVTFSDCMTLLLTFFVLLLSYSSFDDKVFRKLTTIFGDKSMAAVDIAEGGDKDALLATMEIQYLERGEEGSEKPTLTRGDEDSLKEQTDPVDFERRKVFLIPSDSIFWGKGTVISFQGSKILASMASYLKEVPDRVVVSENSRADEEDDEQLGLSRAWAVVEHLTNRQLNKNRFNLSATSAVAEEGFGTARPGSKYDRLLEIVLLERSIYN